MAACARCSRRDSIGRARRFTSAARSAGLRRGSFVRCRFSSGTYRSAVKSASRCARRSESMPGWAGTATTASSPNCTLPRAKLISKAATLRLFSGIKPENLTGGAQWYDYQIVESERLTVAFAAAADLSRADIANYVEAVAAIRENGRVGGVIAQRPRERTRAHNPRKAHGQRGRRARRRSDGALRRQASLSVAEGDEPRDVPKPASDIALAAPTATGRMLTLVPWRGRAMIGTGTFRNARRSARARGHAARARGVHRGGERGVPGVEADSRGRASRSSRGCPGSRRTGRASPISDRRPEIRDHAKDGAAGAMTVIGVKYTTARGVAERAVDIAGRILGRRLSRSRTATTPLPGRGHRRPRSAGHRNGAGRRDGFAHAVTRHFSALYAEGSAAIVRLIAERPELGEPDCARAGRRSGAEVVHVIRHEMAVRLTDIVVRRTALGSSGHPGADAVLGCGRIAAEELGWSPERLEQEIAAVEAVYALILRDGEARGKPRSRRP